MALNHRYHALTSPLLIRYAARISGASAEAVTSRAADASTVATAEIEALKTHVAELKAQLAEVPELKAQVTQFSADAARAAASAAASDERVAAAAESARITSERNLQLERESRELLQVSLTTRCCSRLIFCCLQRVSACLQASNRLIHVLLPGASRKRRHGGAFRRRTGGCEVAGESCGTEVQRARQGGKIGAADRN